MNACTSLTVTFEAFSCSIDPCVGVLNPCKTEKLLLIAHAG